MKIPSKIRYLILVFFALISVQVSATEPHQYNVFLPEDSRGGYGDMLSNIWMAKRIKAAHPGKNVTLYLHGSFKEKFEKLFPKSPDSNEFELGDTGIKVVKLPDLPEKNSIPGTFQDGVCNLAFSFNEFTERYLSNIPAIDAVHDDSLLSFDEFGYPPFGEETSITQVAHPGEEMTREMGMSVLKLEKIKKAFSTGVFSSGLYIDPQLPKMTSTVEDAKKFFPGLNLPHDTLFGLSYTDQPEPTLAYLNAAKEFALLHPGQTIAITVVGRRADMELTNSLPKNLHVKKYLSIPFDELDKLFQQTNFPILVTGDMSNTQALQYEKVFFTEDLDHKKNHLHDLESVLGDLVRIIPPRKSAADTHESYFKSKMKNEYDKYKAANGGKEAVAMGNIPKTYFDEKSEKMLEMMKDKERQKKFIEKIRAMRPYASLPAKISAFCREAAKKDADFEQFSFQNEKHHSSPSRDRVPSHLKEELRNFMIKGKKDYCSEVSMRGWVDPVCQPRNTDEGNNQCQETKSPNNEMLNKVIVLSKPLHYPEVTIGSLKNDLLKKIWDKCLSLTHEEQFCLVYKPK